MIKNLNRRIIFYMICCLVFGLLPGCKKKEDTPKPVPSTKVSPKLDTKVNAAIQKQPSTAKALHVNSSLSLKGKKDPFKPLIVPPEAAAGKAPLPKAKLIDALPIQSHDVNQFIVTGIVVGLKENKALVVDPTGKGYVVKKGMFIGNNGGRITGITASSVEVAERISDNKRQIKLRKIVLPLAKKSKETSR